LCFVLICGLHSDFGNRRRKVGSIEATTRTRQQQFYKRLPATVLSPLDRGNDGVLYDSCSTWTLAPALGKLSVDNGIKIWLTEQRKSVPRRSRNETLITTRGLNVLLKQSQRELLLSLSAIDYRFLACFSIHAAAPSPHLLPSTSVLFNAGIGLTWLWPPMIISSHLPPFFAYSCLKSAHEAIIPSSSSEATIESM
jgi:hypothetical protein